MSTTLAGARWLSVTVVLASLTPLLFRPRSRASSVFGSSTAIHEFIHHDARCRTLAGIALPLAQSGRSERGGDSPEFVGPGGVRPGQSA
jgi:hypothetical protein